MLLKKILYGNYRVRYVICQQEYDGDVSFEFCRWRPLGPKVPDGKAFPTQYQNNFYVRKNPYRRLERLNRICRSRNLHFSFTGKWWVTFYAPEIKEIVFRHIVRNAVWYYLLFIVLVRYFWK